VKVSHKCILKEAELCMFYDEKIILHTKHIQGVPGGKDLTSGECSLGQTIPI